MSSTIFIDIDGTIFEHVGSLTNILHNTTTREIKTLAGENNELGNTILKITIDPMGTILPGVVEKFNEWAMKGYSIVITTARPDSMRDFTIRQLEHHGLFYDHLITGIPRGPRYVINDTKPATEKYTEQVTAIGVPVVRNKGLENVEI